MMRLARKLPKIGVHKLHIHSGPGRGRLQCTVHIYNPSQYSEYMKIYRSRRPPALPPAVIWPSIASTRTLDDRVAIIIVIVIAVESVVLQFLITVEGGAEERAPKGSEYK